MSDRRRMAIGGSRRRLVGHLWGGSRHASRVVTDVLGVAVAAACSVIISWSDACSSTVLATSWHDNQVAEGQHDFNG